MIIGIATQGNAQSTAIAAIGKLHWDFPVYYHHAISTARQDVCLVPIKQSITPSVVPAVIGYIVDNGGRFAKIKITLVL